MTSSFPSSPVPMIVGGVVFLAVAAFVVWNYVLHPKSAIPDIPDNPKDPVVNPQASGGNDPKVKDPKPDTDVPDLKAKDPKPDEVKVPDAANDKGQQLLAEGVWYSPANKKVKLDAQYDAKLLTTPAKVATLIQPDWKWYNARKEDIDARVTKMLKG